MLQIVSPPCDFHRMLAARWISGLSWCPSVVSWWSRGAFLVVSFWSLGGLLVWWCLGSLLLVCWSLLVLAGRCWSLLAMREFSAFEHKCNQRSASGRLLSSGASKLAFYWAFESTGVQISCAECFEKAVTCTFPHRANYRPSG